MVNNRNDKVIDRIYTPFNIDVEASGRIPLWKLVNILMMLLPKGDDDISTIKYSMILESNDFKAFIGFHGNPDSQDDRIKSMQFPMDGYAINAHIWGWLYSNHSYPAKPNNQCIRGWRIVTNPKVIEQLKEIDVDNVAFALIPKWISI